MPSPRRPSQSAADSPVWLEPLERAGDAYSPALSFFFAFTVDGAESPWYTLSRWSGSFAMTRALLPLTPASEAPAGAGERSLVQPPAGHYYRTGRLPQ